MSRKIRYLKPTAGEVPAVRIQFKGADLNDYFSLRKVAREDFGVTQTALGRKIICEWLKRYRDAVRNKDEKSVRQLTMHLNFGDLSFEGGKLSVPGAARKKGGIE